MARPCFVPSEEQRRQVKMLAAFGLPQEHIASMLNISDRTLRARFRQELNRGTAEANSQIAAALYKKAKEGDTTAQIFWLKTRAGWRERAALQPVAPPAIPDFIVEQHKEAA